MSKHCMSKHYWKSLVTDNKNIAVTSYNSYEVWVYFSSEYYWLSVLLMTHGSCQSCSGCVLMCSSICSHLFICCGYWWSSEESRHAREDCVCPCHYSCLCLMASVCVLGSPRWSTPHGSYHRRWAAYRQHQSVVGRFQPSTKWQKCRY